MEASKESKKDTPEQQQPEKVKQRSLRVLTKVHAGNWGDNDK